MDKKNTRHKDTVKFLEKLVRDLKGGKTSRQQIIEDANIARRALEDLNEQMGGGVQVDQPAETRLLVAAAAAAAPRKLAIVVGHTRTAPGASEMHPFNASEYPWNTDLANRIIGGCAAKGIRACTAFQLTK